MELPKKHLYQRPGRDVHRCRVFRRHRQGRRAVPHGVNTVRFAPCARTAWHTHACGQTLHVTDGIGLVQSRGGDVVVMRPGDTVYTPPGEWHWHGAAPTHFMTHLAMWEAPDPASGKAETEWGEHVTDDEYRMPDGVES